MGRNESRSQTPLSAIAMGLCTGAVVPQTAPQVQQSAGMPPHVKLPFGVPTNISKYLDASHMALLHGMLGTQVRDHRNCISPVPRGAAIALD